MPTILELFRGSTFDKAVDSKAQEGKGTLFSQVKSFAEQEVTGVRVKSAVELNNPLIYGNEATRIALRSTPLKDKQIDSRRETGGATDANKGGLIGKGLGKLTGDKVNSISELRDKANDKLGIPKPPIPSDYYTKLGSLDVNNAGKIPISSYPSILESIASGAEGKGIGKFLSGGSPKTIAQQAAGNFIKEKKKELRNTLFGKSSEPKTPEAVKKTETKVYDRGASSYSKNEPNKSLIAESGTNTGLYNEVEVGILGKYKDGGAFNAAKIRVGKSYVKGSDDGVNPTSYTKNSDGTYEAALLSEDIINDRIDRIIIGDKKNELISETGKGFTNKDDIINQSGIYDGGTGAETDLSAFELHKKDFIPLYFRNIVTGETVHFRGTITGLSETVAPTWDSAKFAGNPFSFYTYGGIERSVTFNFTIYPMNSAELANNWTKIEFLTSLTYPLGYQGGQIGAVRAPIVYFTLGDLYKDKESFIDSLQYTIPDNSTWQLDGTQKDYESSGDFFDKVGASKVNVDEGYKLPHMVEVAITMKFIEQRRTTEDRTKLYSFKSITY